jgi:hypothetical protein
MSNVVYSDKGNVLIRSSAFIAEAIPV